MDKNRRSFIVGLAQAASLSAVGGTAVAGFVKDNRDKPLALRPPGAIEEKEFLKTCIRCGLCVEACNTRENIPIIDGKKSNNTSTCYSK
jgi:ferredoxin-type protein NapG